MKVFGILIASMLLFAAPAFAQDRRPVHPPPAIEESTHYGWADVLRVDPVYEQGEAESTQQPHPECYDEQVVPPPPAHADQRAGGTVLGAVIGGVLGNLIGRGNGRKATTVVGAVAGGVVGNNIASANEAAADDAEPPPPAGIERHCSEVANTQNERRIVGYDVEYRYRGEIYMARLPYDPGDRLRVRVSVIPAEQ